MAPECSILLRHRVADAVESPDEGCMAYFFLSYRMEGRDAHVASAFREGLQAAGHEVFMAADSLRIGDNWRERIEHGIGACDYFLVLLSPQSSVSEMVITEVRRVRERRARLGGDKPAILPIRVNLPLTQGLPYDLDGYLNAIQQREWASPADTIIILREILEVARSPATGFEGDAPAPPGQRPSDDVRPLPMADPEPQGGEVGITSRFYQERPNLDSAIMPLVVRAGRQLIKLHGPEQVGKTSLMARVVSGARQANLSVASISFQLGDADGHLCSPERGIKWFFKLLTRRLGVERGFFENRWVDEFGIATDAIAYLTEALLPRFAGNLVVCIDNLDSAFLHEKFSLAFLPLLRELYEQGANHPELKKLRLVVAYSTECWVKIPINLSPFQGVGNTLLLAPFSKREVETLCEAHQLNLGAPERDTILNWLGGQPYLTRLTLHHVATLALEGVPVGEALERVLSSSATDEGVLSDHLRRKLISVSPATRATVDLVQDMGRLLTSREPIAVRDEVALRLVGLGLARRVGNGVTLTAEVYRQYFQGRI